MIDLASLLSCKGAGALVSALTSETWASGFTGSLFKEVGDAWTCSCPGVADFGSTTTAGLGLTGALTRACGC